MLEPLIRRPLLESFFRKHIAALSSSSHKRPPPNGSISRDFVAFQAIIQARLNSSKIILNPRKIWGSSRFVVQNRPKVSNRRSVNFWCHLLLALPLRRCPSSFFLRVFGSFFVHLCQSTQGGWTPLDTTG